MFVALIAGPDRRAACSGPRRAASSRPALVGRDHRARVRPRRPARAADRPADRRRHRRDRRPVPRSGCSRRRTAKGAADDATATPTSCAPRPHPRLRRDADVVARPRRRRSPTARITMIVGANACGSRRCCAASRACCAPRGGAGACSTASPCTTCAPIDVAKVLGLLPQTPVAPDGITVGDLVGRGRYPHQGWFRRWSADDDAAVADGAGGDRHRRPRRPPARRAVRRPAPARLDRHGARAGHRPAAARRADDVPRHQPPGRAARPADRPQPRRRARRSSSSCTTSTSPAATPTTSSR